MPTIAGWPAPRWITLANLAVATAFPAATTYPSVRYAGRLAGDPLGSLAQGEANLVAGAGSQTASVAVGAI